jgi:hypothetical protein
MGYGFTPILKNPHQMRVWGISTKFFPEWGVYSREKFVGKSVKNQIPMLKAVGIKLIWPPS